MEGHTLRCGVPFRGSTLTQSFCSGLVLEPGRCTTPPRIPNRHTAGCIYTLLLDRWWSSLGASLSCVVGGMLSERVGSMHPCMHYVSVSLVQNAVCTCCAYVGKCEKGFVWSNRREKRTYVKSKDAWRHRQGSASMKWFAGLSLVPASQFVARVSLLFAFPSSAFSVL